MCGETICAPKQQSPLAVLVKKYRCGVAIVVLVRRFKVALFLPAQFSRGFVEPGDPGITPVHSGHDHVFVRHDRRSSLVPEQLIASEFLYKIDLPSNFSVLFESPEISTLEINKKTFPIRHWRSIAARGQSSMFRWIFGTEPGRPERFSR